MAVISVRTKQAKYKVHVGAGILGRTGALLKPLTKGRKVMIVSNKKVFGLYGARLKKSLGRHFRVSVHLIPDGEKHKTMQTMAGVLEACAKNGLDRSSVIVALGGGVVGDVAGYAAASYMRGIKVAQIPTTLLAQVDSSVGGKTGVDLKYGKNLAGAFHQPVLVVADVDTLKTLKDAEYRNGLAEVIKHGLIMDAPLFNFIKNNRGRILGRDRSAMIKMVAASVRDKAKVVGKDEKEKGIRAMLNYGHTAGHAIEAAGGFKTLKHGEAVVIGMVIAARMAYKMGICPAGVLNEQIKVFTSFNLIKPLKNLKINNILKRLYNDKKAVNGKIRFVLTNKIGCVRFIESIEIKRIKEELTYFSGFKPHKEDILYAG